MSTEAKSRLSNLFSSSDSPDGSNASLRYTAPKQSTLQAQSQPSTQQQPATSTSTSSILYSTTVHLYKFNPSSRSYTSQSTTPLGCVILGSAISYSILCYNSQKQHLCNAVLSANFRCTLQANGYVNFYEDAPSTSNWSLKCSSEEQAQELMRHIGLVKLHLGIWTENSPWVSAQQPLLSLDIAIGADASSSDGVSKGDTVGLVTSIWRIVGNINALPTDLVTKYSPFETSTKSNLRKLKIGSQGERFQAIEMGVVGMKKGAKRMIVSPPKLSPGGEWLLIEIELMKMKKKSDNTRLSVSSMTGSPLVDAQEHSQTEVSSTNTAALVPVQESQQASASAAIPSRATSTTPNTTNAPESDDLKARKLALEEAQQQLRQQELELQRQQLQQQQYLQRPQMLQPSYVPSPMLQAAPLSNIAMESPTTSFTLVEMNSKLDRVMQSLTHLNAVSSLRTYNSKAVTAGAVQDAVQTVERLAQENEQFAAEIKNFQTQMQGTNEQTHILTTRVQELTRENEHLIQQLNDFQTQSSLSTAQAIEATTDKAKLIEHLQNLEKEVNELRLSRDQEFHQSADMHLQAQEARLALEEELNQEVQRRTLAEEQMEIMVQQQNMQQQVSLLEQETQREADKKEIIAKVHQEAREETVRFYESQKLRPLQNKLDEKNAQVIELQNQIALAEQAHEGQAQRRVEQELREVSEKLEEERRELLEKNEARQRALDDALQAKKKLEELYNAELAKPAPAASSDAKYLVVEQFKDTMNAVYFEFQDAFSQRDEEDGAHFTSDEVLSIVRRVLKQHSAQAEEQLNGANPSA